MDGILEGISRKREQIKLAAMVHMHRIACATSGCALPVPPVEVTPLQFSLRRRKRLSWNIFICGGSL